MWKLFRILAVALIIVFGFLGQGVSAASDFWHYKDSPTQNCRDIEFVFARGSGQPHLIGDTYLEFQRDMSSVAESLGASYRVTDLDYEAVAISTGNILGVYVSAGEAYSFGRSVQTGVSAMVEYARSRNECSETYWVLSGYSQGAMVIANSLGWFEPERVVFIPLFGDPKLYLPEGVGFNPPACRGGQFSSYRVNVPNCDTDDGILNSRIPYEVAGFEGLFGLWCNNNDFICGSSKNPLRNRGHSQYDENGSILEASQIVQDRFTAILDDKQAVSTKSAKPNKLGAFSLAKGEVDTRLPVPRARATQRDRDSFRIYWDRVPERAKYFGIKINGYFLGYTDVGNGEMVVSDVDFKDVRVDFFYLDEELNLGYQAAIDIEKLSGITEVPTSTTGNLMSRLAIISLPFLGGLLTLILLKLLRDIRRIKSAPRA